MGLSGADLSRLGPAAQRQILDKLGKAAKESKYHNSKTEVMMPNGKVRVFDSRREAARYGELLVLEKDGHIRGLRLQAEFTLQEAYIAKEGDRVNAIRYKADFVYEEKVHCNILQAEEGKYHPSTNEIRWVRVVEDAKGVQTDTYKMKKKLMQERFGIRIQEV